MLRWKAFALAIVPLVCISIGTSASAEPILRLGLGPILYAKEQGASWDLFVTRVHGDEISLTSGDRAEWMGVWTPIGRGIVFIAPRIGRFGTDVFRMRADGSNVHLIDHLKLAIVPDISLSPHGKRLAFSASPPSSSGYVPTEIYTYGLVTDRLHRLTNDQVEDGDPDWSPDGTTLAFDRNGVLWTIAPDGSDQQRLGVEPVPGFEPAWAPHGHRIAYSRAGDLFVMSVATSATDRLTRTVDDESTPAWSRDGTHLAYIRSHYNQVIEESFSRLFVMRADGTDVTKISTAGAAHPDW